MLQALRPRAAVLTFVLATVIAPQASAAVRVLYDDSVGLPNGQGAFNYCEDTFCFADDPDASQVRVTAGARLTTTSAAQAGYTTLFSGALPPLDPAKGFAVSFELNVVSEAHNSQDRAGFSVLLLGSTGTGIELGFHESEVFAQAPDFTRAEVGNHGAFGVERAFTLEVRASGYRLLENGEAVLEGPLRDYSAFGPPYNIRPFLFLGDNTTRGATVSELGTITLNDALPKRQIPLPWGALALLALLLGRVAARSRPSAA